MSTATNQSSQAYSQSLPSPLFRHTQVHYMTTDTITAFDQLALSAPILNALNEVGYERPSPIQAETIPLLRVLVTPARANM